MARLLHPEANGIAIYGIEHDRMGHCYGVTAMGSLLWGHCYGRCYGVIVLGSLLWGHCYGVTVMESLLWEDT